MDKTERPWRRWSDEVPRARFVEVKRPEWHQPIVMDLNTDSLGALVIGTLLWREYEPVEAAARYLNRRDKTYDEHPPSKPPRRRRWWQLWR